MHVRSDMARIIGSGLSLGPRRPLRLLIDRLRGTPRILEKRRHHRVRWIESKTPDSDEAKAIREAIVAGGCEAFGDVARYAADRLFRRDLAAGGWLAGVGLFHAWYLLHVCRSLERLHGRLVWIEDEAHPPCP